MLGALLVGVSGVGGFGDFPLVNDLFLVGVADVLGVAILDGFVGGELRCPLLNKSCKSYNLSLTHFFSMLPKVIVHVLKVELGPKE